MSRVDDEVRAKGWFLVPTNGKKPTQPGWNKLDAPRWNIPNGSNYAIRCGSHIDPATGDQVGVCVLDFDKLKETDDKDKLVDGMLILDGIKKLLGNDEDWAYPTVKTGGGGCHMYFKYDDQIPAGDAIITVHVENSLGLRQTKKAKIDSKTKERLITGPGSIHPDTGKCYEWDFECSLEDFNGELDDMPDIFMKLIKKTHSLVLRGNRVVLEQEIVDSPKVFSILMNSEMEEREIEHKKNAEGLPPVNLTLLEKIVMGLDPKRADDRNEWLSVLFAINTVVGSNGIDLAIEFSKQSKKFKDEDEVAGILLTSRSRIGIGTLMMYLKKDNNDLFKEVCKVQFKEKAEAKILELESIDPIVKGMVFDEKYYWRNFRDEIISHTWGTRTELDRFFKENVGRVIFRTTTTGEYFVKISEDKKFHPRKDLYKDIVKFWTHAGDNAKLMKWTFHKYAEEQINDIPDYDAISFNPCSPLETPKQMQHEMNTWSGFKAKMVDELDMSKIQPILDHIHLVWAAGNDDHYDYIMTWIYNVIMRPNRKNKICLVLRSENNQCGKGIIADDFLSQLVIGSNAAFVDKHLDFLTQKFNAHLMGKILVTADEVSAVDGKFHGTWAAMKSIITQMMMGIEIKGGAKFQYPNHMNLILLTNNDFSIQIDKHDKRYAVFECNDKKAGDLEYFNNLDKYINQDSANHFLTYITQMKVTRDVRNIPETELRTKIIEKSSNSIVRFVNKIKEFKEFMAESDDCDKEDKLPEWQQNMADFKVETATHVYEVYKKYCEQDREAVQNATTFGCELTKLVPKKKSGAMKYDFTALK